MTDGRFVVLKSPLGGGDAQGGFGNATLNTLHNLVTMDWMTHAVMMGMAYQVRAGTITTPIAGDVAITDTAAEYCVDAPSGYTVIPVYNNISLRVAAALAQEYAIKSVNAVSTAGAAFVLLPLRNKGFDGTTAVAAGLTARAETAGAVTVTAELATTTRRHWSWSNPTGNTTAGTNLGIFAEPVLDWEPRMPPMLVGPACVYVQIAGASGPSYYASMDVIQAISASLV